MGIGTGLLDAEGLEEEEEVEEVEAGTVVRNGAEEAGAAAAGPLFRCWRSGGRRDCQQIRRRPY